MKTIFVNFTENKKSIKKKIEINLQWYDTLKKKMLHFKGGSLSFEYKEDDYLIEMGKEERTKRNIISTFRMLPIVIDAFSNGYENISNRNEVKKWFNNYMDYSNSNIIISSIGEDNAEFNVPDNEVEDFTDALYRKRFDYNEMLQKGF